MRTQVLTALFIALVATSAAAQIVHCPLYVFNGDSPEEWLGSSVSGAGDVNNDGFADIIVGAPEDDNNGINTGSARVFSGATGEILYTFNGNLLNGGFGCSVSGAGDVNNDGVGDLIVGARGDIENDKNPAPGSAHVFSGATGQLLYTFSMDIPGDGFGWSVSGAGDVNNDGFADLIVGAVYDYSAGYYNSGSARVFSGATGAILYTFLGDSQEDVLGWSVSGVGDVNNDGFDDFIVGAPGDDNNERNSGSARVLSGANGTVLYNFNGNSLGDGFGHSVSGAGDVNNDGFDDFVIGAPSYGYYDYLPTGSASVFSGATGATIYTFYGSSFDSFGRSVSGAGDVNGDGFDDVIVGSSTNAAEDSRVGAARVFSGANGRILYTFNANVDRFSAWFGRDVSGAGDVNNDGFDDFIVGAPKDANSGSARVFVSVPVCQSDTDPIIHSPLYTFNGDSENDYLGRSVSGAGDVNNDGFNDLIVGAAGDNNGIARAFSGATGAILYTFDSDSKNVGFGCSVSGAGDVNNDGFADLIVGAEYDDNNAPDSGSARVFSGATGAILYTFNGDSAGARFGTSVSDAGDVNNDGFDDLIVGAVLDDGNGTNSGNARIFSGATGAILYTFSGDSTDDQFGASVSGAGDVNNDGFDDLIVGAPYDDNNGRNSGSARVFSGANGAILYTFNGNAVWDLFGTSVSGAGDVNNDGFDDLIVGAPLDDSNGPRSGSARVFSGATGDILFTFNGDQYDEFGRSVSGAGDVNNDGFVDLIVGAYLDDINGTDSGGALVFSGATGVIIYAINGIRNTLFGASVSGAGDVNNDGFDDFIVGAWVDSYGGNGLYAGRAFVYVSTPYCPGDADQSRIIDFSDVVTVLRLFGISTASLGPGDLSGDGSVSMADIATVLRHFNSTCP
ncbi:MAG: hypothetical protein SFZ24_08495 [Planctomycetota bacterium]|nr:hypothetical protein [Planctomycetota bacterium]